MSNTALRIVATDDVPGDDVALFRREISEFIPAEEGPTLILRGYGAPQYLELIGRALAWLPLREAAGAFLGWGLIEATKRIWRNRKRILNMPDARLKGVAHAILQIKRKYPNVKVLLGVEFDSPNYPAHLLVDSDDEAEVV